MCMCCTTGEETLPMQAVQNDLGVAFHHPAHAKPGPPALLLCEKDFSNCVFSLSLRSH